MKREHYIYFAVPLAIGMLFWNAQYAFITILAGIFFFLYSRGIFRMLWASLSRWWGAEATASVSLEPKVDAEPTLITMVSRAPYELLGIDQDAGTHTIFHTFHKQAKDEQSDGLRLNKHGRRLTAAKNAMLSQRRKQTRPENSAAAKVENDLKNSLQALLKDRPLYSGKVVQFKSLTASVIESYQVGVEIGELKSTCGPLEKSTGRGSSRFVIQSESGRLLSSSGEGQVVFLPGTRFLIVGREPWQNPHFPGTPPGFSFELVEVA